MMRQIPCQAIRPGGHWHWRQAQLCTLLAVVFGLGACQAQPPGSGPSDEAALYARIKSAVGEAACSQDAQCRSLPLGERPCGGPEQWLPWSSSSPQAAKLPGWAAELAALSRQRNQRSGQMSTCQVQVDPGAVCRDKRCVLAGPAAAPLAR